MRKLIYKGKILFVLGWYNTSLNPFICLNSTFWITSGDFAGVSCLSEKPVGGPPFSLRETSEVHPRVTQCIKERTVILSTFHVLFILVGFSRYAKWSINQKMMY